MHYDFSYPNIKSADLAPLFHYNGTPLCHADGKQICVSFTHAARDMFLRLVQHHVIASEASPSLIRHMTTLDLIAKDALAFAFGPTDTFKVSADGFCLLAQRADTNAGPGAILHTSGGYPVVIDGIPEDPYACASRNLSKRPAFSAKGSKILGLRY